MNILIVGGGYLGRGIAEKLDNLNHEVAIIEESEEKLSHISPDFGGVVFCSFPMDINNLITAGIESCDAVLVTSSDDNLNITIGQIAKNIFNVEKVVSRISDPVRQNVFETFGLQTVCPTNMSTDSMISAILHQKEMKTLNLSSNTIGFSKLLASKKLIGFKLNDLALEDDISAFGLIRNGQNFLLNTNANSPKIQEGDIIVFAKIID